METSNKKEFVELKFTGWANGEIFDSNIPEDLKKLNPEAKPKKTIIAIGEEMVVSGLDSALENKEIGKEYIVKVSQKDGFGERKRELVKTIPLKVFTEQKVNPRPGTTLLLDNMLVKIITVSGARVISDFNNPLAGKELEYKFKIIRKVTDDKEKAEAFFEFFFKFSPKFEVQADKVTIIDKKPLESFIKMFKDKFKDLIGKDLEFKEETYKYDSKNLGKAL